jgi:hypothetical protein
MQKCGTVGASINFISHSKAIHTQEVKISTCASSESTKESTQMLFGPVLHASLFSHSFGFFYFVVLVKDLSNLSLSLHINAAVIRRALMSSVEHPVHARHTSVAVASDEIEEVLAQVQI